MRIFDALNDTANMESSIRFVKDAQDRTVAELLPVLRIAVSGAEIAS